MYENIIFIEHPFLVLSSRETFVKEHRWFFGGGAIVESVERFLAARHEEGCHETVCLRIFSCLQRTIER